MTMIDFPFVFHAAIARFRSFGVDRRGVAAIEFALVLPVLLIFYLGMFEASQALSANSKVASTADTVGNLVTRLSTLDQQSLDNIFDISSSVMIPFDTTDLSIVVTAVKVDSKGKGTVAWSKTRNGKALATGTAFVVPTNLAVFTDSYFVSTSVSYDYDTLFGYGGMIDDMTMTSANTFRPRKSSVIVWQ
jgi:Flp pilus assembly protein TadG